MSVSKVQYLKILSRLQASCVKREYCSRDILHKAKTAFSKLELSPEECSVLAGQAFQDLVKDKFVDDLRYASAFCREKASLTGWGPIKISFALRAKGISDSVIKEALGEIDDESADDKLRRVVEAKWKSLKDDPQGRLKLLRFALSRGYSYDQVEHLVSRITSAKED